jgi:hypothetical protein
MEDAWRLGLDRIWTCTDLSHVWADWFSHYHAWDYTQFGFRLAHRIYFNLLIMDQVVIGLTIVIQIGNSFVGILKR